MTISVFEELVIWQKAKTLSLLVYKKLTNVRDFGFKDQMQRASISVMNNIAEGFEQHNNKQFIRYLIIAKGSLAEVRSMNCMAFELTYIDKKTYEEILSLIIETKKMTSSMIAKLRQV